VKSQIKEKIAHKATQEMFVGSGATLESGSEGQEYFGSQVIYAKRVAITTFAAKHTISNLEQISEKKHVPYSSMHPPLRI